MLGLPEAPAPEFSAEVRGRLDPDAEQLISRYPQSRSALLPLLHLVQAEEGFVSATGMRYCAEKLGLATAEVTAVATFYTMYRRTPAGRHHIGVCTNTLCAVLGGDEIFAQLQEHLGVGNNETTPDGTLSIEHIECNAACDYAPVVMVDWEFFDNQTPESAKELADRLRAGEEVSPTRGARLCGFRETSRVLAGFPDPRPEAVHEGGAAGDPSLVGLRLAKGEALPGPRVVSPRQEVLTEAAGDPAKPDSGARGTARPATDSREANDGAPAPSQGGGDAE
jgi:NADH-quinone oxidoreductase subunit E